MRLWGVHGDLLTLGVASRIVEEEEAPQGLRAEAIRTEGLLSPPAGCGVNS